MDLTGTPTEEKPVKVIRRNVEVVIVVPDRLDAPSDDEIDGALRIILDCITPEEFDDADEHPSWDFVAAKVTVSADSPRLRS